MYTNQCTSQRDAFQHLTLFLNRPKDDLCDAINRVSRLWSFVAPIEGLIYAGLKFGKLRADEPGRNDRRMSSVKNNSFQFQRKNRSRRFVLVKREGIATTQIDTTRSCRAASIALSGLRSDICAILLGERNFPCYLVARKRSCEKLHRRGR